MAIASIPSDERPHLHWIGNFADSWYQEYIVRLAEQHAVTLKLHVLVSDEDLQKAMSEAACFIYTPRLEPFGLTPLEANACGTAVVAIAEGGVRETIQHGVNGLLSLNNDPCQLGQMIAKFTSNLHYAAQMGMQARDHVVKHWKVADAVDRMEQQLLSLAH
jgi:glycosyltransferase involved in cell wall biosynthesis